MDASTVARLRDRLRDALGPGGLETSAELLDAYAHDLSTLGHLAYTWPGAGVPGHRRPDLVARPRDVEGVQAVLRIAREERVPVVPWGAGSGVCGGSVAIRGGVVLDLKGLDRILEIDRRSLLARVQAGVNGQLFEDALQRQGLTCGHFPSSITCSTVGGWVAARGAGQLSTRYGKVEDMVAGLEVVLPDGTLVRTPTVPRAATGPDWNQLFVGCEGVLGVIVAVTLRVHPLPARRLFRSYEFPTLGAALDAVRDGLQRGARPAAVRLYDPLDTLLVARSGDAPPLPGGGSPRAAAGSDEDEDAPLGPLWPLDRIGPRRLLGLLREAVPAAEHALLGQPRLLNQLTRTIPGVGCLLLLSFEGEPELALAEEAVLRRSCAERGGAERGPEPAERWWRNKLAVSFKQSGVYARGGFVDTMEVATRWDRLLELHDRVREALGRHALVMAHFSHAYSDGCSIYFTFAGNRGEPEETVARYQAAWRDGMEAAIAVGAAVSHHHGIGVLKGEALRASHGPLHDLLWTVKQALDPENVLNPGKLGLP